ncbi:MAG: hypothetical protein U1F81_23885 [Verrucomicrobiaceae bacterium]
MGLFDRFFGKKPAPSSPNPPPPALPPVDPSQDSSLIRVFDEFGRELFIPKAEWLKSALLPNIEAAWNDPEKLAGFIINGLQDGFGVELLKGCERLAAIDPNAERGHVLHAVALLAAERPDDAEKTLRRFISVHGESGVVLTNLAKVYGKRKETGKAMDTLWRGLELDPNQDNAVGWYEAELREKDGAEAGLEALRRIAALPGSWRAQLWLARDALKHRSLETALQYYEQSLANAPRPVPVDLLTQLSGDLGNAGHLPEILNLALPHYNAAFHGMQVGNNFIKACLDLGQFDQARSIIDELYAMKRPDWKEGLAFWDGELAKMRLQTEPAPAQDQIKIAMLAIEGPVWLKPDSPESELFPERDPDGPLVCFFGCSVEKEDAGSQFERQMSDAGGRLSRALPLFLAEQAQLLTDVRPLTLIPWLAGPSGGFVVSGVAWPDDQIAHLARQQQKPADYAIASHLKVSGSSWQAQVKLIRTIDAANLGSLTADLTLDRVEASLPRLARDAVSLLIAETGASAKPMPELYQIPLNQHFGHYILRLEQLLAVRCGSMDGIQGFLSGEREIVDGCVQLCLLEPSSVSIRILLARVLLAMKKVNPAAVKEFADKIRLLQTKHPFQGVEHGVLNRLFDEALA